jgi:hypothetical protein
MESFSRNRKKEKEGKITRKQMAGATGLEPAASGVTGRRSNQLSYAPEGPVGT